MIARVHKGSFSVYGTCKMHAQLNYEELLAPAGGVAIEPGTKALLPGRLTASLGTLMLKGKAEPLEAHLLVSLDGA